MSTASPNLTYLKLCKEYVQITQRNYCAAKILAIIEGWQQWKAKHKLDDWVRLTLEQIREHLFEEYSIETIRQALAKLTNKLQLLKRRNNPKAKYDRAYQYQLNREAIEQALAQKQAKTLASSHFQNLGDDLPESEPSTPSSEVINSQTSRDHIEIDSTLDTTLNSTTTEPPAHPVVVDEVEVSEPASATLPIKPQPVLKASGSKVAQVAEDADSAAEKCRKFLTKITEAGFPVTRQLEEEIGQAEPAALNDALAAAVEYRATHEVRNPIGLLRQAIKERWQLGKVEHPKAAKAAEPGFKEWFDLAHRLRLVTASQMMGGEQYILTNDDEWEPWGFLAAAFPVARLRQMLG
jgi:predicted transcriptional regulator